MTTLTAPIQTAPQIAAANSGQAAPSMPPAGVVALSESPRSDLTTIPANTVIPMSNAVLKGDVYVSVDWTIDGVVISSQLFNEEGYGSVYEEALADFLTSLPDKLVSLSKRESRLSHGDRRALDALRASVAIGS